MRGLRRSPGRPGRGLDELTSELWRSAGAPDPGSPRRRATQRTDRRNVVEVGRVTLTLNHGCYRSCALAKARSRASSASSACYRRRSGPQAARPSEIRETSSSMAKDFFVAHAFEYFTHFSASHTPSVPGSGRGETGTLRTDPSVGLFHRWGRPMPPVDFEPVLSSGRLYG